MRHHSFMRWAYDAKLVSALHSAGGFAGQMKTGGAVELGTVNIA